VISSASDSAFTSTGFSVSLKSCKSLPKKHYLEAAVRIELTSKGFAERSRHVP